MDALSSFCHRWQISELAFFGSVLREDFRLDSDIDMLVSFHPQAPWTLFDLVTMQQELETLTGREVDLIEKTVIENSRNPIRRRNILDSAQVIYTDVYQPA